MSGVLTSAQKAASKPYQSLPLMAKEGEREERGRERRERREIDILQRQKIPGLLSLKSFLQRQNPGELSFG
jgi:hypothetical protein